MKFSDEYLTIPVLLILLENVPAVHNGFACISNPCIHGVCLDDINSTYICYCIDGYTGLHCQTNWNECWSSPCKNGGICIDGIAAFNCSCAPGFSGDLCEINVNECESNPCLNNGTCLDITNGYTCNCLAGYSGIHCEIDIAVCNATNETRCANGGLCVEGPGVTFSCKCTPGWTGTSCSLEIDECASAPCQNGGMCVDSLASYYCACSFGFMGHNCENLFQICKTSNCKNNALCLNEENKSMCYCVPDYHGDLCQYQYDECQLGVSCMNGGTCVDGIDNFTCTCPPNLTGVFCECIIFEDDSLNCTFIAEEETTYENISTTESYTKTDSITEITIFYGNTTIYSEYITTYTPNISESIPLTLITTEIYGTTDHTTSTTTLSSTSQSLITEGSTIGDTSDHSTIMPIETLLTEKPTTTWSTSFESTYGRTEIFNTELSTKLYTTTDEQIATTSQAILKTSTERESLTNITSWITEPMWTLGSELSTEFSTMEYPITISTVFDYKSEATLETTSIESTNATNCAEMGSECQNGGTCIFTYEGHKCVCPFEFEGSLCEIVMGVKYAAFYGESYLAHRLPNYLNISIEFEAKTLALNGLLFYLNFEDIFMEVRISDGFMEFKFSCGFQTMLLRELKIPVNNGFSMYIAATLKFRPDINHCNASIKVNNTLSMMGDQLSVLPKLIKSTFWLFLGGIPAELKYSNRPVPGFIGCMKNLRISGKNIKIFEDAEDGSSISECSSLACLTNPCINGGTCVSSKNNWQCKCKNGYLGTYCESSVCENNPCLFGGTCATFPRSGYICLCPYGKQGHFCENDIKINEPYFSPMMKGWSSYVSYFISQDISKNMEIRLKFTPTSLEQISLLLFLGQEGFHNALSDHIAVSFVKGYIMLTWNLGSGPRRIFTSQPIDKDGKEYLLHLGYSGRRAWLFVDNIGNVTGRSPGPFKNLDVTPFLFVGGHESRNFSTLPHDLPLHTGFMGCVYDIQLKSGNGLVPLKETSYTSGRAVGQCDTSECNEYRCLNMGACLHHGSTFTCLCQDSWYGPLCLSKQNPCDSSYHNCSSGSTCVPLIEGYECDCPFGKMGKYCEKDENITDVSFRGSRSFLMLKEYELSHTKFNINMEIKPLSSQGLLFFTGGNNFISLSLQSGILELRIKRGRGNTNIHNTVSVRSSKLLVQGTWNRIHFGVFGRKIFLSVESIINTGLTENYNFAMLSNDVIHLGGIPDMSTLPLDAVSSLPTLYIGCIRRVRLDSIDIPLIQENILSARNVIDCDGTPCGGDSCQNGGTCWLDSSMKPHCTCPPLYFGDTCQKIYNCTNEICDRVGVCNDNKCICHMGWNGAFCENEIIVKIPEFTKSSYLIVDKKVDKKRNILSSNINQLSINFTTVSADGLLIWSEKANNFIGLGIQRGFLKLTYSVNSKQTTYVEIFSNDKVNDGLWHKVDVRFHPWSLVLDGMVIKPKNLNKIEHISVLTDNRFFVGNIPTNQSLIDRTKGLFKASFQGCIASFENNLERVENFTQFEGLNIDECSVA